MKRRALAVPEIALIAGTRAVLGAGLGLLLATLVGESKRRAVGWALLSIGALTTIPIAIQLFASDDVSKGYAAIVRGSRARRTRGVRAIKYRGNHRRHSRRAHSGGIRSREIGEARQLRARQRQHSAD